MWTWHIKNRGISRTPTYSKPETYSVPWYIQTPGILKTLAYSKPKAYSDIYDVKHLRWSVLWKQLTENNSQYKLAAFSTSWNKYHEVVTPEIIILCKKTMALEAARDGEILIYLLIYSNRLAYSHLTTVLVYRNSPPKSHEQDYLNFQQKLWKISGFIFTRYKFTKNELFLRYFLRILFKSFRGLLLPWNLYTFTEQFLVYA